MGFDGKSLDSYVDVATRIGEFRDKHPDGSLQPLNLGSPFEVVTIGDQAFVVYAAAAYRTPDDQRPGVGLAYEQYPGRTPYTKGSELQNAETAAWGRAIVAALAADTRKGIASAEEVRERGQESEPAGEFGGRRTPARSTLTDKDLLWLAESAPDKKINAYFGPGANPTAKRRLWEKLPEESQAKALALLEQRGTAGVTPLRAGDSAKLALAEGPEGVA